MHSRSYFCLNVEDRHRYMYYYNTKEVFQHSWMLTHDAMMIRCGDRECINSVNPFYYFFFAFLPTFDTHGRLHPFSPQLQDQASIERVRPDDDWLRRRFPALTTTIHLGEEHVVFGPEDLIEDSLERILVNDHSPCIFAHTCISKVIGVDMYGIMDRVARKKRLKVLSVQNIGIGQILHSVAETYGKEIRPVSGGNDAGDPADRSVNLVGFIRDEAFQEISSLLGLIGVRVNVTPIPDLTLETLDRIPGADLQVLRPVEEYQVAYDRIFARLPIPTIAPQAPYGLEDTLRWVRSIAEALEMDVDGNERWQDVIRRHAETYRQLAEKAGDHRVGFVISQLDVEAFLDPGSLLLGIPLARLLEEMGFGVEFCVVNPDDEDLCREILLSLFDEPERHAVIAASTDGDVQSWLARTRCRCIYSDLKNDLRITTHGKATFSMFVFEMGIQGAIRSLERMLHLCELDYYDEYKAFRKSEIAPAT